MFPPEVRRFHVGVPLTLPCVHAILYLKASQEADLLDPTSAPLSQVSEVTSQTKKVYRVIHMEWVQCGLCKQSY